MFVYEKRMIYLLCEPSHVEKRRNFAYVRELITHCTRILVPRDQDPFGQHQESRPLAAPNTGSPRFTDSLLNLKNLIGLVEYYRNNFLCMLIIGTGQRSRFLVLTKRIVASGTRMLPGLITRKILRRKDVQCKTEESA